MYQDFYHTSISLKQIITVLCQKSPGIQKKIKDKKLKRRLNVSEYFSEYIVKEFACRTIINFNTSESVLKTAFAQNTSVWLLL